MLASLVVLFTDGVVSSSEEKALQAFEDGQVVVTLVEDVVVVLIMEATKSRKVSEAVLKLC